MFALSFPKTHLDRSILRSGALRAALVASSVILPLAATGSAQAATPYTAYAANFGSASLTPINAATEVAGSQIAVNDPPSVAITPDGKTAWVANATEGTVTPITLATGVAGSPISVGTKTKPNEIAITPDGTKAYVANNGTNTVTPIDLTTKTAGAPITVGPHPYGIAITADGTTAYVTSEGSNTVTPITVATNTAHPPITVGKSPAGIAITPDGATAYVANSGSNTVTPITLATNTPGTPIAVGNSPLGIAVTPDGAKAYVVNEGSNTVTPITLATNTPGIPITASTKPIAVAITPDGTKAYVVNEGPGTLTPINTSTDLAGTPIAVGTKPDALAITPDQAPVASFTATAANAGSASSFDASASTVAYGSITGYHWDFGDGESADTAAPSTTHTYAAAGNYTVTLTETDSAGTSTSKVFTGQTMSRNGGASAQSTHGLTIVPPPPVNSAPPTISGTAQQGQKLTEHNGSWTNGPTSYAYQWLQCDSLGVSCLAIAGATSQSYTPVAADVGHTLAVQETASNAGGSSSPATSAVTAVVVPPPPANIAAPAITGLAQQGQALSEQHGSWTNNPTSYSYQWLRCDGKGASCAPISGATSQSYVPLEADLGHTLRVQEAASNAGGTSSPATSAATAAVVPEGAPVSTAPPTISGTSEQGQTLTEHQGAWTNSPTTYAYQWLRCNSKGEGCAAIAGAMSQSYVLSAEDVGHTLSVQETAGNEVGAGSPASSSATAVVLPPAPANSAAPTISGTAQQGQALSEEHGSWMNNPTSYSYQWLRCDSKGEGCAAIAGATGQSYVLVGEDIGHTISVQETASNAGGAGSPATSSASAVVLVAAPEASFPPTISGTAQQGQALSEEHGSWTNNPTSYAYQWLRCDSNGEGCAAIAGATGQSYVLVGEDTGHTISVQESASNAGGAGSPATSTVTGVVVPPPPANTSAPTISGTSEQGQTLTEHNGSWTNEPTSYSYQWLRCDSKGEGCAAIAGATGQIYVVVGEDIGHTLSVQESAGNAGGAGSPAESPATPVVHAPPAVTPAPPATTSAPPDPPQAPADPPALLPTHVLILGGPVTVTSRGDALIQLSCPSSALGGCRGTLTLQLAQPPRVRRTLARASQCARGCRPLGKVNYEARAGQRKRIRVHMASFRRLVAHHKSVRVTVTATNVSGALTTTTTRTISVKAHARSVWSEIAAVASPTSPGTLAASMRRFGRFACIACAITYNRRAP